MMNKYNIQLYESKHKEGDQVEEHSHQRMTQVLYALGGTGSIRLDGREYEMEPDSIAYIVPSSQHAVQSDDRLTLLVLGFEEALLKTDLLSGLLEGPLVKSRFIQVNRFQGSDLRLLLRKMLHEQAEQGAYSNYALTVYTQELLLLLVRTLDAPPIQDANMIRAERIRNVVDQEYYRIQSADDISAKLGISSRYVNRIFKDKFGITPKQYLNEVRIQSAQRMLRETDKDIVSICFEVGYDSMSTFYRIFKNETQISPHKYRQLLENTQDPTVE